MPATKESTKKRIEFQDDADPPASPPKKRERRTAPSTLTSPAASKRRAAAVTPGTPQEQDRKALSKYVPTYIHKNLEYSRQGEASLPEETLKAFRLVAAAYDIPDDLEQRRSFGPLSGSTYEERVLQAYMLDKLEPKESPVKVCTSCATIGHKRMDCPTLV